MAIKTMLPEGASVPTSVDVFSVVAEVGISVSVTGNAAVSLAELVVVDMLEVWLGVVTLDVNIVNSEAIVLGTDEIRSAALFVLLRIVVVAAVAVVVVLFSSIAFRVLV